MFHHKATVNLREWLHPRNDCQRNHQNEKQLLVNAAAHKSNAVAITGK
jgi:hypothetical protein